MGSAPTSTTTQSGTQQTQPWGPAIPYLNNILGETGKAYWGPSSYQSQANSDLLSQAWAVPQMGKYGNALDKSLFNYSTQPQQGLLSNAYGNATGTVNNAYNTATGMIGPTEAAAFAPVTNAYSTAFNTMQPYLNPNFLDPNSNPYFANTMKAIGQQAEQGTNSLFAAAGRDPAGNAQAAKASATAMANALAPYAMQQFDTNAGLQQGAATSLGALGLGTGQTIGNIGMQGAGLFGNLGLGTGSLLGNLGISTSGALTEQQNAQQQANLQGVNLAEALPGLWTTPGTARQKAATAVANQPIMNLPGLESIINPIAGLGNSMNYYGTGQTQYPQSMMSNILGGALGANALLGGQGMFGSGGAFGGTLGNLFGGGGASAADFAGGSELDSLAFLAV